MNKYIYIDIDVQVHDGDDVDDDGVDDVMMIYSIHITYIILYVVGNIPYKSYHLMIEYVYGTSSFFMGNSLFHWAIFNSKLLVITRGYPK